MAVTLTRSKAAFHHSVETFFRHVSEGKHKAYLWTFTFEKVISVKEAFQMWNKFAKSLWKYGLHPKTGESTIFGLRVAELHPGGHGVHFHVLVNRRIPIQAVRRRAEQFGMFWIDVQRAYSTDGSLGWYLAKYLAKGDRPPCFKGRRLWQAFGQWGQTRCKDIEVRSEFCAAFKARRELLNAERRIAEMEGRPYRVESNLETMAWAKEHCFQVLTDKVPPLCPELWFYEAETPSADIEDWESAWDDALQAPLPRGRNLFGSGSESVEKGMGLREVPKTTQAAALDRAA